MDEYQLLADLHEGTARQGPGGEAETLLAMKLAGLDSSRPLRIADIGCGTGASSVLLAGKLNAHVVAVDLFAEFLGQLDRRAAAAGVADRITTLACSMDALPFREGEFDVVWSEGAAYCMGFEAAVSAWGWFLKPGGVLAVSEITWLGAARPSEIQEYWEREYPEIDVASAKMGVMERCGYSPEGYFVLPPHCWREHYYRPLERRFDSFLARHGCCGAGEQGGGQASQVGQSEQGKQGEYGEQGKQAQAVIDAVKAEIALYEQYGAYYGYGFYVGRRL